MTTLKIRVYPDPILRKEAAPVEVFDAELEKFIEEMFQVMRKEDGVGLAAPQVGVSKQVAVVSYGGRDYVLINPKVLESSGNERREEGCLSVPGIYEEVERPYRVVVEACDVTGKVERITAEGFLARAFLHEIDHLRGKLFIDYLSVLKRQIIKKKMRKHWKE